MLSDKGHVKMCLSSVSIFRRRTVFELLTPVTGGSRLPNWGREWQVGNHFLLSSPLPFPFLFISPPLPFPLRKRWKFKVTIQKWKMYFLTFKTRFLGNFWTGFHQTFSVDAFWDKDKRFNCRVKRSQHDRRPSGWMHAGLNAVRRVLI